MTAIKKFRPELSPTLLYWVYDVVDPTRPFSERMEILKKLLKLNQTHVGLTLTSEVSSPGEVLEWHRKFVSKGYEGSMVRYDFGGYDIGHRNNQLQKVKDFVDAEFEVLSIMEGGGRFKGAAIFECRATANETFTVVPEGDMIYRRDLFNRREEILSTTKYLTVRYQELSKDGVPIFPVGVSLRESKDGGF
jgi:DNA ligase-1